MKNRNCAINDYRRTIIENAEEACRLRNQIDETFRIRPHGPLHIDACSKFHTFFQVLINDIKTKIDLLAKNDPDAIEYVIQFLEVDPRFFRSGYLKEVMATKLKRSSLSTSQKRRLQIVLLRHFQLPYFTKEFKFYIKLSPYVQDEAYLKSINLLKDSTEKAISKKAFEVLKRQIPPTLIPSSSKHPAKNPFADTSE
jgi:hypothetical protein